MIDKSFLKEQITNSWDKFCPSCGSPKDPNKIKFIRSIGKTFLFISECSNCGLKHVIAFTPNVGFQTTQLKLDLYLEEINKFAIPLTQDDYLHFYKEFKKINTVSDLINFINKN